MSKSLKVSKDINSVHGHLEIEKGATGVASSITYIKFVSSDGTEGFLFMDNSRDLKIHTAAPTADGDGSVVGSQS